MPTITALTEVTAELGEGPVWDAQEERLYWVDGEQGRIFRCTAAGGELRSWQVQGKIGSLALRQGGGAVLALSTGLVLFDFATGGTVRIAHPEAGLEGVRLNDGKVDRQGRFVVGSLDMKPFSEPGWTGAARGSLYRLDTDLGLHRLATGIGVSNGPCWSPDGAVFYFSDSLAGTITRYSWDVASGGIGRPEILVDARAGGEPLDLTKGMPDGATVDAEGGIWSAFYGSGRIFRYTPEGRLDRSVELPVRRVTSVSLGGPDLDVMFVTTAAHDVPPPDGPLAGRLFRIEGLGVRGVAEPRFAG